MLLQIPAIAFASPGSGSRAARVIDFGSLFAAQCGFRMNGREDMCLRTDGHVAALQSHALRNTLIEGYPFSDDGAPSQRRVEHMWLPGRLERVPIPERTSHVPMPASLRLPHGGSLIWIKMRRERSHLAEYGRRPDRGRTGRDDANSGM